MGKLDSLGGVLAGSSPPCQEGRTDQGSKMSRGELQLCKSASPVSRATRRKGWRSSPPTAITTLPVFGPSPWMPLRLAHQSPETISESERKALDLDCSGHWKCERSVGFEGSITRISSHRWVEGK